jgi:hypothetical protein
MSVRPSTLVMGGGHDGNEVLGDVDAELEAVGINVGEPVNYKTRGFCGDVQKHAVGPALFHFAVDGPSHDVARGEGFERVITVHEGLAGGIAQNAAFAAHRFADEKGFGGGMIEAGGMELNELHIGHGGPRAIGHGDAVAGGDVGIGGVKIDFAAAAGGQEDKGGGEGLDPVCGFVKHISAQAAVARRTLYALAARQLLGGDKVDGEMVFEHLDVGMAGHGVEQSPLDFAAGDVLGVQDAAFGMTAFAAQIQFAAAVDIAFGKFHAEFDQFGDAGGALGDDGAHDLLMAEAGAGGEGVAHVHFDGVLLAGDGGDAALGVVGVGFGAGFLGGNGDAPQMGGLQREGKAGNAAAQDQEVKLLHEGMILT